LHIPRTSMIIHQVMILN